MVWFRSHGSGKKVHQVSSHLGDVVECELACSMGSHWHTQQQSSDANTQSSPCLINNFLAIAVVAVQETKWFPNNWFYRTQGGLPALTPISSTVYRQNLWTLVPRYTHQSTYHLVCVWLDHDPCTVTVQRVCTNQYNPSWWSLKNELKLVLWLILRPKTWLIMLMLLCIWRMCEAPTVC